MARVRPPRDPFVLAALAASFALCLHGITATVLHPDQMALRPLFLPDRPPFDPGWFEKPPGYSYVNWLLTVAPVQALGRFVGATSVATTNATIVWSRVVATGMLLATVVLAHGIAARAFGAAAARATAAVLATAAGMIAFVHQLTADVPVTAAMLVALHFAVAISARGRRIDYVGAGLATGAAAAVKYNGLGVGIAIVAAHAIRVAAERHRAAAPDDRPGDRTPAAWWVLAFDPRLWLGLAAVPLGFVLLNPYAVLDFPTFWADFRYNALVTPVYEGQTGRSWGTFFARLAEAVGVPATIATLAGAGAALVLAIRRRRLDTAAATFWTTLPVVLFYYATFASFPRLETRFVLPIVPFLLLLAAPAWARLHTASRATGAIVLGAIALHGIAASAWVGRRFLDDPRIAAASWLAAHVAPGSRVEADEYSPGADVGAVVGFTTTAMPFVTGRERLFRRVFAGDRFVLGSEERQRELEAPIAWYTIDALAARAPDYVVVDSLYYDRFLAPGPRRELYPSMVEFFTALLDETGGYRIAFDRRSPPVPAWVYPRDIDFLDNRATVLQRADAGGRARK